MKKNQLTYIGALTAAGLVAILVAPSVLGAAGLDLGSADPVQTSSALTLSDGICVGQYEENETHKRCDGVWVPYPEQPADHLEFESTIA